MRKILIVDYSALMRKKMCDIINADEDFCVVDMCAGCKGVFDKINTSSYDLIVLNVEKSHPDSLVLMEQLYNAGNPIPVIAVGTELSEDKGTIVQAMELGAYDFVARPAKIFEAGGDFAKRLLKVMHLAAKRNRKSVNGRTNPRPAGKLQESVSFNANMALEILKNMPQRQTSANQSDSGRKKPLKQPRAALEQPKVLPEQPKAYQEPPKAYREPPKAYQEPPKVYQEPPKTPSEPPKTPPDTEGRKKRRLVALACSTGGPQALQSVIPFLPADMGVPLVLVQHMPSGFTGALAARLDQCSKVHVKEAEDEEKLKPGWVYIAPGGKHLEICENRSQEAKVHISDAPPLNSLKPCADIMYDSLQKTNYDEIICVVLTGMGADGTKGIQRLKKHRHIYCISESEETCVVYGMPKAVADAGLADEVVPINKIVDAIMKKLGE